MKLTKQKLKQLIKEELAIHEKRWTRDPGGFSTVDEIKTRLEDILDEWSGDHGTGTTEEYHRDIQELVNNIGSDSPVPTRKPTAPPPFPRPQKPGVPQSPDKPDW